MDLSRFCAVPGVRSSHLPFERDRALSTTTVTGRCSHTRLIAFRKAFPAFASRRGVSESRSSGRLYQQRATDSATYSRRGNRSLLGADRRLPGADAIPFVRCFRAKLDHPPIHGLSIKGDPALCEQIYQLLIGRRKSQVLANGTQNDVSQKNMIFDYDLRGMPSLKRKNLAPKPRQCNRPIYVTLAPQQATSDC